MKLNQEKKAILINLIFGIILYLVFYILDLFVYPEFSNELLVLRLLISSWWGICIFWLFKIKNEKLNLLAALYLVPGAFGISLMCCLVGQGFSSIYFVGNLLVVIGGGLFARIKSSSFIAIMIVILGQHLFLQSLLPYAVEDFMITLFFLGSGVLLSISIHISLRELLTEIKTLQDFLPICMHCKKVKNDAGAWDKIEKYISRRTNVSFSHGMCPECEEKCYQDDLQEEPGNSN